MASFFVLSIEQYFGGKNYMNTAAKCIIVSKGGIAMFIQYNPNPIRHTDDCVIRAIAKVSDLPWEKAYMALCLKGLEMYDLPNNNAVWGEYLRQKGYVREQIENTCPNCYTVEDFCHEHPLGVYVLGTGTHAIAVIDGNFYDSYYSGDKVPMYAYRKE